MEIFKIRNKEGLYWEGYWSNQGFPDVYDRFSAEGKLFFKLSRLNQELDFVENITRDKNINLDLFILPEYLKDCEIVKFELVEVGVIKID